MRIATFWWLTPITFKFAFGECGKRDGQMLYPNRVAVARNGDVVVTERSPTHQIQVSVLFPSKPLHFSTFLSSNTRTAPGNWKFLSSFPTFFWRETEKSRDFFKVSFPPYLG
jgi:hypothetical protein